MSPYVSLTWGHLHRFTRCSWSPYTLVDTLMSTSPQTAHTSAAAATPTPTTRQPAEVMDTVRTVPGAPPTTVRTLLALKMTMMSIHQIPSKYSGE